MPGTICLSAALILASFSVSTAQQPEPDLFPVAIWPADKPLPTRAELDALNREQERALATQMERMQSVRGGCEVWSTNLENFTDIVALSSSDLYEPTRIVYIDASAPLGGDGSSWNNAYQSIQDALGSEPYDSDLVEFRLAGGTYRADTFSGFNTLDPKQSIELPGLTWVNSLDGFVGIKSLKGGYAGRKAKNPDERDIELYPTVFTGDLLGDDDPQTFSNYEDNTKVLFLPNETELNGITIEHARVAAHELRWMTDCTIRYCFASGDDLPVEFDFRAPVFAVEARLVGNTFHNNRGESYGGALGFEGLTVVANSRFLKNTAPAGGAIGLSFDGFGTLVSQNCYFAANIADGELGGVGGVIYLAGGLAQFVHCTFVGNAAIEGGGGGVWNGNSIPDFRNCIFDQNYAYDGTGVESEITPLFAVNSNPRLEANLYGLLNPALQSLPTQPRIRLNIEADSPFADLLGPDGHLGTVDDDPSLGFDSAALGRSIFPPSFVDAAFTQPLHDLADLDGDCDIEEPLPIDMLGNPRAIESAPGEGVDGYPADAGCIEFVPGPDARPSQQWTYIDPLITDFSTEPIRLFVDANAPNGGDGLSWSSAFSNPCHALEIAARRLGPVEIWVAAGEYAPTCADSGWNGFRLRENVTLLGGFAGTEGNSDQRDWFANETTLTGDLLGNDVIADEKTFEDNAPHVVASLGVRGGGVIDGFTIRDGQPHPLRFGTGLFWTSLIGLGSYGDTIVHGCGELVVRNCRIGESNRGVSYGTVGVTGDSTHMIVESSVIHAPDLDEPNSVGAVTRFGEVKRQIPSSSGSLTFTNCTFDFPSDRASLLSNVRGWNAGPVEIHRSVFRTALDSNPNQPLIELRGPQKLHISNTLFASNGVGLRATDLVVTNSTFHTTNFTAIPPAGFPAERNLELYSSVFASPVMSYFASQAVTQGCVVAPTIFPSILDSLDDTNLVFDFEANAAQFFADPLGPDGEPYTGDEDLRLAPGSPAINTGLNAFVDSEFDIDGNPRIIGSVVDRGAYEFTGTCTGDVNGDGVIDLADLNRVLANYEQDTPFGDADGDGSVTMTDLNLVLAAFGNVCPD